MKKLPVVALLALAVAASAASREFLTPLPDKVPAVVADRQPMAGPDRVRLAGYTGNRVAGNERARLLAIDTDRLLEGYRKRPGRQSWDGEHVGKWLHAATLAWANTGDPALREKIDRTVAALLACQLEDGYLGTYLEKDRWSEWDVWAHKYNLIGLLTYMRTTGDTSVRPACQRMGDLLCRSFGDDSGKLDIVSFGHHVGLATTSVLEPMVWLYRATGEQRYLDFCQYLVRAWEQPNGPKVISRLLQEKRVDRVGNGKAYEMLSCLVGALELHRTTGEPRLLEAARHAWQDIVANRLYLTGTASYEELFHGDHDLPNLGKVGETCVTVTWIQFNAQLLRLTGEARYAEELERTVLNQLFGAQQPDCTAWGYYVEMEGIKPYSSTLDGHCCLSSGPRGVALIPTFAATTDADGVVLNLYSAGRADLTLADGTPVVVNVETSYPTAGAIAVTLQASTARPFALKLRTPAWCEAATLRVNGQPATIERDAAGYRRIHRVWAETDRVELHLPLAPRVIVGDHANAGKVAFAFGPLVLAADEADLPSGQKLRLIAVPAADLATLGFTPLPAPAGGLPRFRLHAIARSADNPYQSSSPLDIQLTPFAEAGASKSTYRVWLPLFDAPHQNLAALGTESFSRALQSPWGSPGSIIDGNRSASAMIGPASAPTEDWFAVTLPVAAPVRRIAFYQGWVSPHGGWFDTSVGKPRIQIQESPNREWLTVGEFADYPATTAANAGKLKSGQRFEFVLPETRTLSAVRVIGRPAGGNAPQAPYASAAELEIFSD